MSSFALYTNGRIRCALHNITAEQAELQRLSMNEAHCLEVDGLIDNAQFYIDETVSPHALSVRQSYSLDVIPLPSTIYVDEARYDVTEQSGFDFIYPGDYKIRVVPESPAYLEMEFIEHVY